MFTGIIEEVGHVRSLGGGRLRLGARRVLEGTQIGDSIAVNGVCLTVTSMTPDRSEFTADVMPETVRRTSLSELQPGSPVNLERALTLSARLGGHIVAGHVDGVGTIAELHQEGNAILMRVTASPDLLRYIVEKGSVALDGISLTVAAVTAEDFTVSLIPHTREVTNLGSKQAGSRINIETDMIGKYVEKLLAAGVESPYVPGAGQAKPGPASGLTAEFLQANGF